MMTCKCPQSAALTTIPVAKCPETFGQIQKVAFQRLYKDDGTPNFFNSAEPDSKDILKLASWTPLLTADDSTKIVVSPYIQAPTAEGGEAVTFGGGNETLNGVEMIINRNPTPFTGVIRQVPQSIIKALKELQCEALFPDSLGVYFFDANGAIGALQDATVKTKYYPIPIQSLFVADKTLGGYEATDSNAIQWLFAPNWSDDLVILAPEFNPLTALKPADN